jgi:hypothetical protein
MIEKKYLMSYLVMLIISSLAVPASKPKLPQIEHKPLDSHPI